MRANFPLYGEDAFADAGNPDVRWLKGEGGKFAGSEPGYGSGEEPSGRGLAARGQVIGHGYSTRARLVKGVIHTDNVYDAARALYENRQVRLAQPRQVSTLIHHLGRIAQRMIAMGKDAPIFNLCNVSIGGTNLFCAESKGIPRVKMPQLEKPKAFREHLQKLGYKIEKTKELASRLRATQNELNGAKVAGVAARLADKGFDKRLIVSRDNYILDGHHRWAAMLGIDAMNNRLGDIRMKVARVDIDIVQLLHEARKFTKGKGGKGIKDRTQQDEVRWIKGEHGWFAGSEAGEREEAEETAHPPLNPEVIDVDGDEWNLNTALRLETEYEGAKDAIEADVDMLVRGDPIVPPPPPSWSTMSHTEQAATPDTERIARLAKPWRKLGQVCDARWTI